MVTPRSGRKVGRPRKLPMFAPLSGQEASGPPVTPEPPAATLKEIEAAARLATREGRLDVLRLWIAGAGIPDPHGMFALQFRARLLELLMRSENDFPASASFSTTKVAVAVHGGDQKPALVVLANSRGPRELQAGDVVDATLVEVPESGEPVKNQHGDER